MKSKHRTIILLPLLLLAACIPQNGTQQVTTPLVDALPTQTDTATPAETATSTQAPTAQPTTTPAPSPTATTTSAPESLKTTSWRWIKMFDPTTGWGVGSNGALFHMTGETGEWQDVTPPEAEVTHQVLTSFLDPQHAWLIYHGDAIPVEGPWDVWHTTDGGQSWTTASISAPTQEGLTLIEALFVDANNGWVLGQIYPGMNQVFAVLYASSDAGATWQTVSNPMPASGLAETNLPGSYSLPFGEQPLTFISPEVGFAGGDTLYKTQDGGRTWQPQPVPEPPDLPELEQSFTYLSPPRFSTAGSGILQYLVFDFENVFCPPCDIFAAPPAATYVYLTQDGGDSWTPQPAPGLVGTAGMVDAETAWFLGREQPSQAGTNLYLSRDLGATWIVQSQDNILPLGTRMYFTGGEAAFAYNPFVGQGFNMYQVSDMVDLAGQGAYFYFTEDGGVTWAPFPPAYP